MCGLVGAFKSASAQWTKVDHFMWQGLYMSALRGMGGTGVGLVMRDFDIEYSKSHVSAPNFLCTEEWDWVDKNLDQSRGVLGHTRSPTLGAVKTKNSQPFCYESEDKKKGVLMIHNGHVKNWSSLSPNTFHHEVDSAHVAYSLFDIGGLETLKKIDGAYTLIWYDKASQTMNLARNEERELFFVLNKEKTQCWFASELDMLSSLLRRNGIAHAKTFYELPKMTMCSYDLTKTELVAEETKYETKKYQPAYPNVSGGHYESGRNYKDFTKPWAGIGDYIFVNVADDADVALKLYKEIGDGEDQVSARHAYGYAHGTRAANYGSIVRINGIEYLYWKSHLKYIKDSLPCKVTRVERGAKNENGITHDLFECCLDMERVEEELSLRKVMIAAKKHKEQLEKTKSEAADDDAAGRALPDVGGKEANNMGPNDGGGSGGSIGGVGVVAENPTRVPGPRGTKISWREWETIAAEGCYFCEGIILPQDTGIVEWWEMPRCPEDRKDDDIEWRMICPCCKENPKALEKLAV